MKARNFLEQIEKMDRLIDNKLIEKDQWYAVATGITARMQEDKVQATSSPNRMEDAVLKMIECENEINRQIDAFIDKKRHVISVIEQLDTLEYDILHKRYVQYISLEDIADIAGKSASWARENHNSALKDVQRILDESEVL